MDKHFNPQFYRQWTFLLIPKSGESINSFVEIHLGESYGEAILETSVQLQVLANVF